MIVLLDWGQALDQIIVYFISGRQQSYRKSLSKITGNFGKLSQKYVQEVNGVLVLVCFTCLAYFMKWRASKNWSDWHGSQNRVLEVLQKIGLLRKMASLACFIK